MSATAEETRVRPHEPARSDPTSISDESAGPDPRPARGDEALFRPEALEAATSRFGLPVRPMGVAGWVLTGFMVLLFVSVLIFLSVGRYTRKETVPGILQPTSGASRVSSIQNGTISEVFVQEGQAVRAGQPLFAISTDLAITRPGMTSEYLSDVMGASAEREARALAARARAVEQSSARTMEDLVARRIGLAADRDQIQQAIELQHDRIRLAEETLAAGRALHERQLFSTLQLRQREEALIAAKQQLGSLERELRRNQAALGQLAAEAGRIRAQADQSSAEIEQATAQLEQRDARRQAEGALVVTASKTGRIVAIQARPGATVQAGRVLAMILPEGQALQAELWVPSRAAGFLRPGDRVRLMYDAFPYQKFGVGRGVVSAVAGVPTDPQDLAVPIETKEALYRVVVTLENSTVDGYGKQWQLTPGMRLSADLVLDDRSFWEWLLDPLIAARRRGGA